MYVYLYIISTIDNLICIDINCNNSLFKQTCILPLFTSPEDHVFHKSHDNISKQGDDKMWNICTIWAI